MLRASYYVQPTELDLLVFQKLVPADHSLRQVKALIDFECFRTNLADCYSSDEGRPADDPLLMLKLGFLAFHYNLSDRRVLAETQVNVAFRLFVDLSLDSELPHPSLLSVFRSRLGESKYQAVFTAGTDLEEPERLLQRVTHLREILAWVDPLYQGLPELPAPKDAPRQTLGEAVHLAHKVLSDREDPKATDKLISIADPDARVGKHGSFFNGYLLDVAMDADSQIITALSVVPANGNEIAIAIWVPPLTERNSYRAGRCNRADPAGRSGPAQRCRGALHR